MPVSPEPRRLTRWQTVLLSFIVASVMALLVQRFVPQPATDVALLIAVWAAFYPVARLKHAEPRWAHWARGVAILIGFWIARRLFS